MCCPNTHNWPWQGWEDSHNWEWLSSVIRSQQDRAGAWTLESSVSAYPGYWGPGKARPGGPSSCAPHRTGSTRRMGGALGTGDEKGMESRRTHVPGNQAAWEHRRHLFEILAPISMCVGHWTDSVLNLLVPPLTLGDVCWRFRHRHTGPSRSPHCQSKYIYVSG